MMDVNEKLAVLSKIGEALNRADVAWAVGGSLMLYLYGKTDVFHDIDLVTTVEDAQSVKTVLLSLGKLLPSRAQDMRYQTKYFWEFQIDGVDIDVMAGFAIVRDGVEHDCSFHPDSVAAHAKVNGAAIPLQSMAQWLGYYTLMERWDKVKMIRS